MSSATENELWVARLQDSAEQAGAVAELRAFLLRGLRAAYARKGCDESFCDDIVQEAMIKIMAKLNQFGGRSKFTTWAMTIAIRTAVDEFRRRKFESVSLEQATGGESLRLEVPARSRPVDSDLMRDDLLQKLGELIENELTEKQRLAIQAGLGGLPVNEIARRMGSNRNAIYKLVHDARQRLKQGMEDAGYRWPEIEAAIA